MEQQYGSFFVRICYGLKPLLLAWINFNSGMDK